MYLNSSEIRCKTAWSIPHRGSKDEKLWVGVFEQSFFFGDDKLGSAVIPMEWLPMNQVLTMWIPLKITGENWSWDLSALLQIHMDTIGAPKFCAPAGNLMTWKPQPRMCFILPVPSEPSPLLNVQDATPPVKIPQPPVEEVQSEGRIIDAITATRGVDHGRPFFSPLRR
jgi:hypothetical protein